MVTMTHAMVETRFIASRNIYEQLVCNRAATRLDAMTRVSTKQAATGKIFVQYWDDLHSFVIGQRRG